jgi:hypothetical protein
MQDEPGFLDDSYVGTKWSYEFHQRMDRNRVRDYVKYKFLAYDKVDQMSDDGYSLERMEGALADKANVAFVSEPLEISRISDPVVPQHPQIFDQGSDQLNVEDFGLNYIKLRTNFPKEKFFVYNDSYHPGWRVYVDGKRNKLYRANMAFKGIWLEPGPHHVVFRYGHPEIYLGLVLYFMAFFIFTAVRLCKRS